MQTTDDASVARARETARATAELLARHGVPGEIVLTGGSSLPGLLTKGDVDLHLRADADDFAAAVDRLPRLAEPVHRTIWTDDFATFERTVPPVVGIAVTVVGGEHDLRFTRGWARLRDDPSARFRYNQLKLAPDVEEAKAALFDRLASGADPRLLGTESIRPPEPPPTP